MAITENKNRIAHFTSSEIWKLTKLAADKRNFGEKALTYIKEKQYEAKLKRSINTEATTRPMLWGKFLEPRVHDLLPTDYEFVYDESIIHPSILTWSGSPDFINRPKKKVSDLKCLQPKAFAETVENLTEAVRSGDIKHFKDNHEDKYWQLMSNAVITGMENIELILYMPYEKELTDIRMAAENFDGDDQFKYRFIYECDKSELAYLPNDSEYKNLNLFNFPVIKKDVEFLTDQVFKASLKLKRI